MHRYQIKETGIDFLAKLMIRKLDISRIRVNKNCRKTQTPDGSYLHNPILDGKKVLEVGNHKEQQKVITSLKRCINLSQSRLEIETCIETLQAKLTYLTNKETTTYTKET